MDTKEPPITPKPDVKPVGQNPSPTLSEAIEELKREILKAWKEQINDILLKLKRFGKIISGKNHRG